jgi:hypothetical protein
MSCFIYCYAECHYADCHVLFTVMMSVIMLNIVMLSVVVLVAKIEVNCRVGSRVKKTDPKNAL